ncbi:hypothetical protein GGQ92_002295 [Gracilibacillus halotolerans]|uniref:Uncharacterized protein YyaB-like PH domain-containing protein n=1 Tax=Gracilibacillus halotolerans TaxID=74386 RepID=A0A841RPD8_9BACI|nr:hypothetical protein [Gracilibacillus halotolerans]
MYFPSKKDTWLAIVIWGPIILFFLIYIIAGEPIDWKVPVYKIVLGFFMTLLIIGLPLWMWFGTGYKIEDGLIKIKSGPFKSTVRIKEIEKLSATRNPLSAPALSIDRIEILHGMYNIAIVSPNNKTEFIRILVNENSNIHVDENLINHVRDKR